MNRSAHDPYCYPGTDVLRNMEDIRDRKALDRFEADAVAANLVAIRRKPISGSFDIRRLQETHRRIFARIYPWAGEFRTGIGMMAKNRSGFTVAYGPSSNVPGALDGVFAALNKENCLKGLDLDAFVKRIAYYYSELDAIHPFREGNSRTLRAFTADLASEAGHTLDWSQIGSSEEARKSLYHARDLAVMRGDLSELIEILSTCLPDQ